MTWFKGSFAQDWTQKMERNGKVRTFRGEQTIFAGYIRAPFLCLKRKADAYESARSVDLRGEERSDSLT